MSLLLLALLAYAEPEDYSIYYALDANIGQYSRYWEELYETSLSGFRTSQGCHDMKRWYQIYEAKTEAAFGRALSLRYQFFMIRDYDKDVTRHRFEPTARIWRDLYAHLVISPAFYKKDDEAGLGLAWRRGSSDWLAVYAIAQSFDHNFSLEATSPGPERDPFTRIPLKLEIDTRGGFEWLKWRAHVELGTRANQYLDWPDSIWEVWDKEFEKSLAWGRLEVRAARNLWIGSRFGWERERSRTLWPGRDTVTADTLEDMWFEPFVSLFPTERLEFRLEYRIWDTHRYMDSVSYYRDYDVLSALASWNPLPVLWLEAGYQRSWRFRYNNDTLIAEPWSGRHTQSRILVNLEMRLKSGMMFTIKEGLEMDFFPKDLFRSPHNHTYVELYLPLVLPGKDEKPQDTPQNYEY